MGGGEQEPRQLSLDAERQRWNTDKIGEQLHSAVARANDIAFGQGFDFRLGTGPGVHLELYPDAGVARVTSQDAQITLLRADPTVIGQAGIIFESRPEGT